LDAGADESAGLIQPRFDQFAIEHGRALSRQDARQRLS
jgi:hypothetical protein